MHVSRFRELWIALPLFVCGCAAAPKAAVSPGPASAPASPQMGSGPQLGDWRVSGSSMAGFSNTDVGNAETTTLGLSATGGKMMTDNVLLEGVFEYTDYSAEIGNEELDLSLLILAVGARYYFDTEGNTYPYARGLLGLTFVDADDDDSSPGIGLGVGAETFLNDTIALDYGLRFLYAFDIFDEELTDLSLLVGFSFWF